MIPRRFPGGRSPWRQFEGPIPCYAQEARVFPILFLRFIGGVLLALLLVGRQEDEHRLGRARR